MKSALSRDVTLWSAKKSDGQSLLNVLLIPGCRSGVNRMVIKSCVVCFVNYITDVYGVLKSVCSLRCGWPYWTASRTRYLGQFLIDISVSGYDRFGGAAAYVNSLSPYGFESIDMG